MLERQSTPLRGASSSRAFRDVEHLLPSRHHRHEHRVLQMVAREGAFRTSEKARRARRTLPMAFDRRQHLMLKATARSAHRRSILKTKDVVGRSWRSKGLQPQLLKGLKRLEPRTLLVIAFASAKT